MSKTPRTDAEVERCRGKYQCLYPNSKKRPVGDDFARQLECELHLANQAASDNADWFNSLVNDLADMLNCERKPSVILEVIRKRETELIAGK